MNQHVMSNSTTVKLNVGAPAFTLVSAATVPATPAAMAAAVIATPAAAISAPATSAPAISAVAMWAVAAAEARMAARAAFGRTAAAAHAWDTTGGAPSSQAYPCTELTALATINLTNNPVTAKNKANATCKTNNKKRPPSWSGPPNG